MIDHNIRRLGIGGSDVAAIFGADEFKDAFAVWAEKKGGFKREPGPGDERMMIGKVLEPAILELYGRVTGRDIEYCDVTYQHPVRKFQVYTPDALVTGEKRGVDAKAVFWDQRNKWGSVDDAEPNIPQRVLFQAWWYMSAMDYPKWDICALLGEGLPRIYTVDRLDVTAERRMLVVVEEWWRRYIVGDDRPDLGNSETAAKWLAQTYPEHKRPDMREATAEESALLERYVALRLIQRGMKAEQVGLENAIKDAIADREGLNWDGNAFTWRRSKDGEYLDVKALVALLLHRFVPDPDEQQRLKDDHTRTKPGTRRIHVNHPDLRQKRYTEAVEQSEEEVTAP